jgi:murein DD-endopeptidase MepM/ murein hydrolase activator NlpD
MKPLIEGASKLSSGAIAIIIALALLLPIAVIGGTGAVVVGTVLGVGAALKEGPTNCKAPPNLFDAWETLRDFVTGIDCSDVCSFGDGTGNTIEGNSPEYVKQIVGTGKAMGVSEKGQIIAITTALVESNLKLYANDGVYDTGRNPADSTLANPSKILGFIKLSLNFPHDSVGSDASSVGLFQQQAWWGAVGGSTWENDPDATIKRLMDPVFQSQKFYDRMLKIPNWEQLPYGTVAQRVQVSAFPGAYEKRVEEAKNLYAQYSSQAATVKLYDLGQQYGGEGAEEGSACGGTGLVLDKTASYRITQQWGSPPSDIRQGRTHAGMDIDCVTPEPVYAPIDGIVTLAADGNSSGFGSPMGRVNLKSGDGAVFGFLHLRKTFVEPGTQVTAGTPLGECASTGNSTGDHLHLEVNVGESTNASFLALPKKSGIAETFRDPALVLALMGVDICPPYTAHRKTVAPGSPLVASEIQCWPREEWVR